MVKDSPRYIIVEGKSNYQVAERMIGHTISHTLICTCRNLLHAKRIAEAMNIVEEQHNVKG